MLFMYWVVRRKTTRLPLDLACKYFFFLRFQELECNINKKEIFSTRIFSSRFLYIPGWKYIRLNSNPGKDLENNVSLYFIYRKEDTPKRPRRLSIIFRTRLSKQEAEKNLSHCLFNENFRSKYLMKGHKFDCIMIQFYEFMVISVCEEN